jgi:predicted transcriptional regulator
MIAEIEKRIKQLGIKKSHVAKHIGLSPSQFSHYLKGQRDIPIESETKLKTYLKV